MGTSLEQAVELLTAAVKPTEEIEWIGIEQGLGRILAEDLSADFPQPPFDRSPLDGYALRAEDTASAARNHPVVLKVIDKVMAGCVSDKKMAAKTAVRIMTGAPVPEGADCVIRQEDTDYGEETVAIYRELKAHDNICDRGEDYPAGAVLARRGERIDATLWGIIAGAGVGTVPVYRRVKVALLTSGDEVLEPGEKPAAGKIYNSNRYLVRGRLEELGFAPVWTEHVRDDAAKAAEAVKRAAAAAELVITTGGVSVGQKDVMHEVAEKLGAEELFWRVAMKPGSPVMAYRYGKSLVVGMSGNPFGAFVNMEMLVRPLLAHMSRDNGLLPEETEAVLSGNFPKSSPVRRLIRGVYRHGTVTIPESGHSSGMLASMKGCNCLVDIPGGSAALTAGERVAVRMI